jgi:hypothetical protein
MLPNYIQGSISVSIDQPPLFGAVQATLDTLALEGILRPIISVPHWQDVSVKRRRFTGVGLFLFDALNPVPFAEAFQLAFEGKYRNLSEFLIVSLAHVDPLLEVRVITDNNLADAIGKAPIHDIPGRLIQEVVDLMVPSVKQLGLPVRQSDNTLLVLNRLKASILLVVPLVDGLNPFAVNDKRLMGATNAGSEVVQTQIDAKYLPRLGSLFNCWRFVDIGHVKVSRTQSRDNANLFDDLIPQPLGDFKLNASVLPTKRAGHWNLEDPILIAHFGPVPWADRNRQQEMTILRQVSRYSDFGLIPSRLLKLQQLEERPERPVYNLQCLLSYVSRQLLIVLILLCVVIITLVGKVFALLKKVLTHVEEAHIEHVFAQVTHLPKRVRLLFIQPEAVSLIQEHFAFPLDIYYSSGSCRIMPAKLALLSLPAIHGGVPRRI